MNIKNIAFVMLGVALMTSCSSKRDTLSYFQDLDVEQFNATLNPEVFAPKIEPSDELIISVSSLQPELSLPYNLPLTNPAASESGFVLSSSVQQATYFVSSEGDITMPLLGKIHVAGMTTDALADYITGLVAKEVQDPVVVVKLLNFKIDVAGEVTKPGRYTVNSNRFSILDALSEAGDLTPYGERSNVIIVREEKGKRVAHTIDLTKAETLTSPYFYLKQNDYVYVAPNKIRKDNSKYNQNNAFKLSVISTVVSGVSVIASLVIALAIK